MLIAGRLIGLLLLTAAGLMIGRLYHLSELFEWPARLWPFIVLLLASLIAFVDAVPVSRSSSRYDSTHPSLSGERIFLGVVGVVMSAGSSCFMLAVGILAA